MRRNAWLCATAALFLGLLTFMMVSQAEDVPKIVILKGSPLGAVKMDHAKHVEMKIACETCHHASKPEKPKTSAHQACTDCHTKVAQAPMKTKLQAAFHNPAAKKGLCIDCHIRKTAKGVKSPAKCTDCHDKANG